MEQMKSPGATALEVKARIDRMLDGESKTQAFASIELGGEFVVRGLRVVESDTGRFVAMPQRSYETGGETKYQDTFFALTDSARAAIAEAVTEAYEQALLQEQTRAKPEMTM